MNVLKIPLFKQNNILCIITKVHKKNLSLLCMPTTKYLTKGKAPVNVEKDVCVFFKVKNNLIMFG